MCDKAVDTYPSTIKFVSEFFMAQEMCDKVVNIYFFAFDSIPDWYKTRGMCGRVASEDPFLIVTCYEAVGDSLATLKLISDWFFTSKMIKKLFASLYADKNILYFN